MTTFPHLEDEMLAGHLEGALDRDDEAIVAEHLATCAECVERLTEVRSLLALLPATVDDLTPPQSVRDGLLAAVAIDLRAEAPSAEATPLRPRRPSWLTGLAVAAALLAAAILGAATWSIVAPGPDQNRELLQALTGSDEGVVLPMRGTEVAPDVRAALLAPADMDRVYVVASNVPPPPSGQAYHLYLYIDGVPQPAIVLQPDANGRINAVLDAPLDRFDAMEVDLQPANATSPGGSAVLRSRLP